MGWFDQETKDGGTAPVTGPDTRQRSAAPSPAGSGRGSSTIGKRVQIKGTVVSDEDLEIIGKVEGTIHARKALRVAPEADVKAVINGTEVLVEGTVNGDINASQTLVLGATAVLTGNIKTPTLQIREGAFFRGQVTMQQAEKATGESRAAAGEAKGQKAAAPSGANGSSAEAKRDSEVSKDTVPATKPVDGTAKPGEGPAKPAGVSGA